VRHIEFYDDGRRKTRITIKLAETNYEVMYGDMALSKEISGLNLTVSALTCI